MIDVETTDGVAVVTLGHGKVNAIDFQLAGGLADTLGELAGDARPVVLTGSGTCFSAGVDLRRLSGDGPDYVTRFMPSLERAFLAVFDYPAPIVAAINGHVLAGGYVVACGCDWRVMAQDAGEVGLTELLAGVPFPTAALEIVRFAVGELHCRDLVLTGRRVATGEAERRGLVDQVVPAEDLLESAVEMAKHLAGIPPDVYALSKKQLHRTASDAIVATHTRFEPQVNDAWASEETAEFVASYIDRVAGQRR